MSSSSATSRTATSQRHLRILYADDMPELLDLARIFLSREGHGVETCTDGMSAFNRIQADPEFDLVITDHHMPNMNGLQLVESLRAIGYTGRIMVFSSELSPDIIGQYEQFNVDRTLMKPVHPSQLREALQDLFPSA